MVQILLDGDVQPLEIPMSYGGGLGGFDMLHLRNREFVAEYPSLLFGITETIEGQRVWLWRGLYTRGRLTHLVIRPKKISWER